MGTKVVVFDIKGTSSLLMNNPLSMQKDPDDEGIKGPETRIPPPEKEVKRKYYETEDKQLYIPSVAFRGALVTAGKNMKIGKFAVTQLLKGGVFVVEEECCLVHPETKKPLTRNDTSIDIRRAVVVRQGILRARPKIEKWACQLVLDVDDDYINEDAVLERLRAAGKYPGVLDFRPECGGPYGRFEVV